jgi:lipoprotein-anchoring transpeptidase ErfK/SrfK
MYDMTRRGGLAGAAALAAVVLLMTACTASTADPPKALQSASPTSVATDPPLPAGQASTEPGEPVTDEGTEAPGPSPSPSASPVPAPTWTVGTQVHKGDAGAGVLALQRRLSELGYDPGRQDARLGMQTRQALWAFQHVNNLPAEGEVDPATSKALGLPRQPDVLGAEGGPNRVEVNIAKQVAVVYLGGKIRLITHISSGSGHHWCEKDLTGRMHCANGGTPRGHFAVYSRLHGWRTSFLGKLYKPSYFKGGYALHGSLSVPNHPASHGCVRIPMHVAQYLVDLTAIGMPVIVA